MDARALSLDHRDVAMSSPRETPAGHVKSISELDEKKQWDGGLNFGLVHRHDKQKQAGERHAKPEYYAEGSPAIRYIKAVAYAFIAIVPYLAVFDTLGHNRNFIPCNDVTCHYVRLFNTEDVPGTGINVMGVRNGVARPLALHYHGFNSYACPFRNWVDRNFGVKIWGDEGRSCPHNAEFDPSVHRQPELRSAVESENHYAQELSWTVKWGFYICKGPLWLFGYPINLMAKTSPRWGMEHVPPAICPNMTMSEMQGRCDELNQENSKGTPGRIIHNPLGTYTMSRVGTLVGLFGYASFTALHDVLLLYGVDEVTTLTCGFVATCFYGMAAVLVFFWAMGAAEIFVAAPLDNDLSKCACYYFIPEVTALVALTTPFALFASFMARVQMQGLAALFGDYLTYVTSYIPHYLQKQSFLWTWAVLCSPKMAGTITGDPRGGGLSAAEQRADPDKVRGNWNTLCHQQSFLYWLSQFVQCVVALCASVFMIAFKELLVSLYLSGNMTPTVQSLIKWVALPLPSLATLGIGFLAAVDVWHFTVRVDEGETFVGQLTTLLPVFKRCVKAHHIEDKDGNRTQTDRICGWITFVLSMIMLTLWTLAVAQGLAPHASFMFGLDDLHRPKLAQAEIWGSSGFIFFLIHVPRLMSVAFSTWDDMESLKFLSQGRDIQARGSIYEATDPSYKRISQLASPNP